MILFTFQYVLKMDHVSVFYKDLGPIFSFYFFLKSSLVKELVKQQVLYIMIQSSKGQLERLDWLQPNETEASCDQLLCCSMNDKGNN